MASYLCSHSLIQNMSVDFVLHVVHSLKVKSSCPAGRAQLQAADRLLTALNRNFSLFNSRLPRTSVWANSRLYTWGRSLNNCLSGETWLWIEFRNDLEHSRTENCTACFRKDNDEFFKTPIYYDYQRFPRFKINISPLIGTRLNQSRFLFEWIGVVIKTFKTYY